MSAKDRTRGSFDDAVFWTEEMAGTPMSIHHIIDNDDGTFSLMSHINCEYCDYCEEHSEKNLIVDIGQRSMVSGPHKFKEDSYERQKAKAK